MTTTHRRKSTLSAPSPPVDWSMTMPE
jgi:hypothetical protein